MKLLNISVKRPSVVNKLITSSTASTSRFQSSWDNTSSSSSHSNSSNSEKTTINSYGRTVPSSSSYSPRFNRDHPPHSSSKPANQRFKKQVAPLFNPPPTEKELGKREEMRVKRAERLERKDLTAQLTETKTYMGGFTQPRHLAFLNTLDPTRKEKDSYAVRVGSSRVRPSPEAYEPHVVYLAVTRYPIKWAPGRATRRECFSGFVKESDLAKEFEELNYGRKRYRVDSKGKTLEPREELLDENGQVEWACNGASKEYCDLAVWPGSPEARSLLNRKYYSIKKAIGKAAKAEQEALEAGVPLEESEMFTLPPLPDILPPVVNWTRPPPPYLDHRLIVPLLTVTLPTRPLAATLARLCNAHPRGLPFYASVPNDDRKDGPDFFRRLLRMRANRIRELTGNIVEKLDGYGGGLFGLRLNSEDKGRGVEGESLGEEVERPEGGWAKIRFLNEDSEIWEGIEKDVFVESWTDLNGAVQGADWDEKGESLEVARVEKEVETFSDFIHDSPPPPREVERASL